MTSLVFYDAPDALGREILGRLKERAAGGEDVRFHDLSRGKMEPCTGCFSCWVKSPGECIFRDDAARFVREMVDADRILFLCPVTWGGYSAPMKILMDRSICLVLPFFEVYKGETHHPRRYKHYPQTFLAGYGRDLGDEERRIFLNLGEDLDDNMQKGGLRCTVMDSAEGASEFLDAFLGEETL